MECPFCSAELLLTDERLCATCGELVEDLSLIDPMQCSVWVSPRDELPNMCCVCGRYCDRFIKVKSTTFTTSERESSPDDSWLALFGCLLTLIFGPLAMLFTALASGATAGAGSTKTKNHKHSIAVRIPQCPMCRAEKKIRSVDIRLFPPSLKFKVHRDFKDRFQAMRDEAKKRPISRGDRREMIN